MGISILGVRATRRIGRFVGEPVLRAWGGGHPSAFTFVTPDHRHGEVDLRSGEVEWGGRCPSSCRTLFGGSCPRCGHEQHDPVGCTRRVRTSLYGVCYHRDDTCPDPDLHTSDDRGATAPCPCEPDPDWRPEPRKQVSLAPAEPVTLVSYDECGNATVEVVS